MIWFQDSRGVPGLARGWLAVSVHPTGGSVGEELAIPDGDTVGMDGGPSAGRGRRLSEHTLV